MLKIIIGAVVFIALFYGGVYMFSYADLGSGGAAKTAAIATGAFVGTMILIPVVVRLLA